MFGGSLLRAESRGCADGSSRGPAHLDDSAAGLILGGIPKPPDPPTKRTPNHENHEQDHHSRGKNHTLFRWDQIQVGWLVGWFEGFGIH